MENNENQVENVAVTPAAETETNEMDAVTMEDASAPEGQADGEKVFTRNDVVELMKKRVARSHDSFFKRYGVSDLNGLDELFSKANEFDRMSNDYASIQLKNAELAQQNAFLRNNVSPERYADVTAYFKGTGTEFTEDALKTALGTHPEWLNVAPEQPKTAVIRNLGSEAHVTPQEDALEKAARLLGVKL